MATAIRTSPATLNESTLESNIAAEITGLFNSPFNFGYSRRLRHLFNFRRMNLRFARRRKAKIYRLTPSEEQHGGGWDTKISIPITGSDDRAIFIQFKRGQHSDGNQIPGSIFNLSHQKPNPHAEFKFNNNTNNNQHEALTKLSDSLGSQGISRDTVMYAFPRITSLNAFDQLDEDLLLHTTFLTVPELEQEASKAGTNLNDGAVHYFRTCYWDEHRREIASDPFQITNEGNIENVLFEILATKVSRVRNQYSQNQSTGPVEVINNELILTLAEYLSINPFNILRDPGLFYYDIEEFDAYFQERENRLIRKLRDVFGSNVNTDANSGLPRWRSQLLKRIAKHLYERNGIINIKRDIPSVYTFSNDSLLTVEGIQDLPSLIVF